MDFYGEVLRELLLAFGAALFVANLWALVRRRADARDAAKQAVVRGRPGSPVRRQVRVATTGKLAQAPVARTVTFMVLGLVIALAALASLTS